MVVICLKKSAGKANSADSDQATHVNASLISDEGLHYSYIFLSKFLPNFKDFDCNLYIIRLVTCFGFGGSLRQYFNLY